ncbi:hypothetical protein MHBO_004085 [Bonamia ostreae]|uniref:Uncharacterized protein n=1 Tax=Bonamia ostreae TaxID=126728 RepID=A0ABV2AT09_9EUKA
MTIEIIDNYYRDFLTDDILKSLQFAKFAMKIVEKTDKELYDLINLLTNEVTILSWIMTWFSQNKYSMDDIWNVFDFINKNNLVMPYYIAAQKIISNKDNLMCTECIDVEMKAISSVFNFH